ncbi:MAG TPA: adenylate/guanylate cyclase domain-containing protein, partial [Verrucomicrobia bacterium]|nr:adenylate/guanylate cyclase domain-containing protein [Verrucomicrobiota bacterium]
SETLHPEQVVSLLNNYLGVMTDVIIKYEGTIDEFIGDAILVVFGAPIWKSNHAERAVACALEMQNAMEEVNRRNFELGFPEVEMGIGINTGEVVVGNIGSEKRAKYGVVGREVNMASRIETYTVGGQILISESVYNKIESMATINQEMVVEPKGAKKPITIYDVVEMKDPWLVSIKKTQDDAVPLKKELAILYIVLDGKSVDQDSSEGSIVSLSKKYSKARIDPMTPVLSNILLQLTHADPALSNEHIYAKVIQADPDNDGCVTLRFTSVPSPICDYFKSLEC